MTGFVLSLFGVVVLGLVLDVFNFSSQLAQPVNFIFNLVVLIILLTPIVKMINVLI
ncbi:MAG: hypothetical protein IJA61_00970 [Clostridia bacterium]|nr:hypothetical protein [Clostridia bacterium]